MREYILFCLLILGLCINTIAFAADWMRTGNAELTLENDPNSGEIGIIKIKAVIYTDIPNEVITKVRIYCGIPEGLEFINDRDYTVERKQSISKEWFNSVTLYEGPMKKNEIKEILFKVRIPDTKKYIIFGGVTGSGDRELEIDLGDPEPPEWDTKYKKRIGTKEGKQYILSGIKQLNGSTVKDLDIPIDTLPPLRTELRIRTKDKPYVKMPYNPKEIPLRYLVYTEDAVENAEITVELPQGLELINDKNYEVTLGQREGKTVTIIEMFQGPMGSRESKAFYLKVRSDKEERFKVRAQTKVLTYDGEELIAEDYQVIELGRVLL